MGFDSLFLWRKKPPLLLSPFLTATAPHSSPSISAGHDKMEEFYEVNIDDQANSKSIRGRGRNKNYWNDDESMILIRELQELSNDPMWKTDCGFKNKYMHELHRRILLKDPSFSKQPIPHIESKLKWLKTKYHAISEMIKESGCTWSDEEHKIQCEKEWYDHWVKRHVEARGTREMSFPYLKDLDVVYGKDRATGKYVEDYTEAVNNMDDWLKNNPEKCSFTCEDSDDFVEENSPLQDAQYKSAGSTSSKRKHKQSPTVVKEQKKMKTQDTLQSQFADATKEFTSCISGLSNHFKTIASVMESEEARESELSNRKKTIIASLSGIGLSREQVWAAADLLALHGHKLEIFSQLEEGDKYGYIISLLFEWSKQRGS